MGHFRTAAVEDTIDTAYAISALALGNRVRRINAASLQKSSKKFTFRSM
jgi:hypothetical protein